MPCANIEAELIIHLETYFSAFRSHLQVSRGGPGFSVCKLILGVSVASRCFIWYMYAIRKLVATVLKQKACHKFSETTLPFKVLLGNARQLHCSCEHNKEIDAEEVPILGNYNQGVTWPNGAGSEKCNILRDTQFFRWPSDVSNTSNHESLQRNQHSFINCHQWLQVKWIICVQQISV